jgi:hypothetical protein
MEYAKPAKSTICLNVSNVIGSSFEFCQNNKSAQSCRSVRGRDRQFISEFPSEFKFRSDGRQSSRGAIPGFQLSHLEGDSLWR